MRLTAIIAGAGLMLSAPVLFAIDGQTAAPNDLKATNPALFMEAANNINRTEIDMGRLAQERGLSPTVRALGARMAQDHTILENKLKTLATTKDVVLPSQLDAQHQKMVDELATYNGEAFDRQYITDQVKGHQKAIALFQDAAAENTDRSVRDFAVNTIPELQHHLQMAEKDSEIVNEPAGARR